VKIALALACAVAALAIAAAGPDGLAGRSAQPPPARAAHPGASPGAAGHAVLTAAAAQAALSGTPHQIAWELLIHHFHWRSWQFKYLDKLWTLESGWNRYATNPYSGAYGIPQAVPGSKMATAGPNWRSDARTQIRWGLLYIEERYRTPYWAWRNERTFGWY
jgi:hypothetical protein